jgi:pimeloyl-ACP methyl ester carboxylesterase
MEPPPSHGRTALSTGVGLTWSATGAAAATPVVLLHGWAESRGVFSRLLPLLPPTIRAVAPDLRGHGEADKPAHGYALADAAEDVVALMDGLALPGAVLLGSSSGGYVAQQVALAHPRRVRALVLVGSPRSLQGRAPFADEIDRLADPVDPAWVRATFDWFPAVQPIPARYLDDRVRDGARMPARVWRRTLEGLTSARPPSEAGTITAPTLLLWGACDNVLTREDQEALAEAAPGARLVVYEDTGHLVLWERPARVAADLVAFLGDLGR